MILEKARLFARNCGDTGGKEKFLSTRWLEGFKQKHKSTEQPQLQSLKAALHGPQSSSIPGSPMVHYRSTRNPANMIRCSGTNPEVIEAQIRLPILDQSLSRLSVLPEHPPWMKRDELYN